MLLLLLLLLAIFVITICLIHISTSRKKYKSHKSGAILITGAASGIGRHASEYLAHKYPDYTIFVGVRKLSDGENIVDSNKDCKNIYPVILDISDHQSVVKGIETIVKQLKDKNIELIALVNNAGVAQGCPFEYHPIEEIKKVFNVNVFGTMDLTQQLLPFLRKSRGRVITLSSIAGIVGTPLSGAYSSTKFAVEGWSDALRRECGEYISISIVEPGYVKTNMADDAKKSLDQFKTGIPSEGFKLYKHVLGEEALAKQKAKFDLGDSPKVTSEAIEHAIVDEYPKTRYPVANSNGIPSSVLVWVLWAVNDRIRDKLVLS